MGDEHLGPVDQVVVFPVLGADLETARIGPGTGLGEREATKEVSLCQPDEVADLLRLVPELEQGFG